MILFTYFILTTKLLYLYNESGGGENRGEAKLKVKYITNKVIQNKTKININGE